MNRTICFLFIFLLAIVWSCRREDDASFAIPQSKTATPEVTSSISQQATNLQIPQSVALDVINANYGQEFYPITLGQVKGVSRQELTQWLQSNAIAAAKQYLIPALSNTNSEYVIIKNVKVLTTGQLTTVALIGVPSQLSGQYAEAITIEEQSNVPAAIQKKICTWMKCSRLNRCITRIRFVPASVNCPVNECSTNNPCTIYAVPPGTTIGSLPLREAIAAF